MKYEPGDIIVSSQRISLVRWFMQLFQRDPVKYSHAKVVFDYRTIVEAFAEIRVKSTKKALKGTRYKVYRYRHLTLDNALIMLDKLEELIEEPYSIKRLVLLMLDHFFTTTYFTGLLKNRREQVCSSFVAYGWACINVHFGVSWESCDPDHIDDWCSSHPEDWEVIEVDETWE